MSRSFRLSVESCKLLDSDPSAIQVIDQDGLLLARFSGPMSFQAAGAFIKYYHEAGLIAYAMDRFK